MWKYKEMSVSFSEKWRKISTFFSPQTTVKNRLIKKTNLKEKKVENFWGKKKKRGGYNLA